MCIKYIRYFVYFWAAIARPYCNDQNLAPLPSLTKVQELQEGAIPIILLHGNHAELDSDGCAGWYKFIQAANNSASFKRQYRLYVFRHDTARSIGYNGGGNARELGDAITSEFGPSARFGIIAHSRGGLVARSYMNFYGLGREGDRVLFLVTLGTPHHGSPLAVPDWGLFTINALGWHFPACIMNTTYNLTGQEVEVCAALGQRRTAAPAFDIGRAGDLDLAWDNFEPDRGIPFVPSFTPWSASPYPIALSGLHTLSLLDANTTLTELTGGQIDTDLHPPSARKANSLEALNSAERYADKIIAYGGYFTDIESLTGELTALRNPNNKHLLLSFAASVMTDFASKDSSMPEFAANDGLVPLQSALFLSAQRQGNYIFETTTDSWFGRMEPARPLKSVDPTSLTRAGKAVPLRNYDHLDLLERTFDDVHADIDRVVAQQMPINAAPTAGFTMVSIPITPATQGQTLAVTVNIGGSATVFFDGAPPRSSDPDGTVTGWNWAINGASASTSSSFSQAFSKGTYTVGLVVTDNTGASSLTATATLKVVEQSPSGSCSDCGSIASWQWQALPSTMFSSRNGFGLAYDATRHQVVGFGGYDHGTQRSAGDTWVLGDGGWQQVFPEHAPGNRDLSSMAYDEEHQLVILFGGVTNDGVVLQDTWTWDGTNWSKLSPGGTIPNPRFGHRMVYDRARKKIVLFGGYMTANEFFTDTWTWEGNHWLSLATYNVPTARVFPAIAYDDARQQIVLYGGTDGINELTDTWVLGQDNVWRQLSPATSPGPTIKTMAYDPRLRRIVLMGPPHVGPAMWLWDGINWERIPASPEPQTGGYQTLVYDSSRDRMLLVGTSGSSTFTGVGIFGIP